MTAILYQKRKKITQSGYNQNMPWIIEYIDIKNIFQDPVMGWIATKDIKNPAVLEFSTQEEALRYAKSNQILLTEIRQPKTKQRQFNKSYTENFL